MKKANIHKFLYLVSVLLILGFAVHFGVDAYKYDTYLDSAPLWVYALVHAVTYLVPSLIIFIVALIVKKKLANKENNLEEYIWNLKN